MKNTQKYNIRTLHKDLHPEVDQSEHILVEALSAADAMQSALKQRPGCYVVMCCIGSPNDHGYINFDIPKHVPYTPPIKSKPDTERGATSFEFLTGKNGL